MDEKKKTKAPDRVGEMTSMLPLAGPPKKKSKYKDTANALLERVFGKKKTEPVSDSNSKSMRNAKAADRALERRAAGSASRTITKNEGMKTSPRPKPRPKSMEDDGGAVDRGNRAAQLEGMKHGGKVTKMSMGGKCRGMGAASRGGKFTVVS